MTDALLLGCGNIGIYHLKSMIKSKKFHNVDIVDPHIDLLKDELQSEFSFLNFHNCLGNLSSTYYDNVTVCLPPHLRHLSTLKKIQYRRLVLEKPITDNIYGLDNVVIPYLRLFDLWAAHTPKVIAKKSLTITQSLNRLIDKDLFKDLYSHLLSTISVWTVLPSAANFDLRNLAYSVDHESHQLKFLLNDLEICLRVKTAGLEKIEFLIDDRIYNVHTTINSILRNPVRTSLEILNGRKPHPYDYLDLIYLDEYDDRYETFEILSMFDHIIWSYLND